MIAQWKPILLPDLFTKEGIDAPEHGGFFQGGAVSFDICGAPEHAGETVESSASVQAELVKFLGCHVFRMKWNVAKAEGW